MLTDVLISCLLLLNLSSYPVLHHVLENGLGICTEYTQITLCHSQSEPLGTVVVQILKLHISVITWAPDHAVLFLGSLVVFFCSLV